MELATDAEYTAHDRLWWTFSSLVNNLIINLNTSFIFLLKQFKYTAFLIKYPIFVLGFLLVAYLKLKEYVNKPQNLTQQTIHTVLEEFKSRVAYVNRALG